MKIITGILLICSMLSSQQNGGKNTLKSLYPDQRMEEKVQNLYEKYRPAYVFVAGGSGALISPDGLVLTNSHVIRNQKKLDVRLGDGRSFKSDVLGKDPKGDLALLKIRDAKDLPYFTMGDSDALSVGEMCIAIGNPFGKGFVDQNPTLSFGVVSALHQYQGNYSDAIATDAPINPGNSGGPLINMKGELVGINGMMRPRWGLRSNTGIGYAIPANQIKRWIPLLKKADGKDVNHARLLGITWENDEDIQQERARIQKVEPGSDACEVGFRNRDIILTFDGQPVWSAFRFHSILGTYPGGEPVTIVVNRNDKRVPLEFILREFKIANFGFVLQNADRKDEYLKIGDVDKGSPAEKAGLKKGDHIESIQGRKLSGVAAIQKIAVEYWMKQVPAGSIIRMEVFRGKGDQKKTINLSFKLE